MAMIEDGAINWPRPDMPIAGGFDLKARKDDIYQWVRQIRGGVLAGAFTVERNMTAAIVFFFLGDRVMIDHVQDAFDEGIVGPLTFERRINVIGLIAPHLIGEDASKALCADLNELKALRNSMAHKPHWYEVQTNEAGEVASLVPFIMRGKGPLPLTTALIEETNSKVQRLIVTTRELAEAAARKGKAERASAQQAPADD